MFLSPISTADFCPVSVNGSCQLHDRPVVEIETGNAHAPHVEIYTCIHCGHGVTRPAMDDVAPLYDNRASEDFLARDAGWVERLKSFVTRRLARKLLSHAPKARKVGDFGTGNGALASAIAEALPVGTECFGLDFFDKPPAAIGNARYQSFAKARRDSAKFDMITCFHVLEHDDQPRRILDRISSMLKPGGVVALEVPNVDCVWNSWFGAACSNWYAPFHRVHFSRNSLKSLVETADFEVIEHRDICGPTIALSLANLTGIKPNAAFFAIGLMFRPIQWIAEKLTARPSALRIIARKERETLS